MSELAPDVIIQAGAGIVGPMILDIPKIGSLNIHHGIAPSIKGMNSMLWALWYGRRDWLGATLHWMDESIDTGAPIVHIRTKQELTTRKYGEVFFELTELVCDGLAKALLQLESGHELAMVEEIESQETYRSSISGWKLGIMEITRKSLRPTAKVD